MLGVLPLLTLVLAILVRRAFKASWRDSCLQGAIGWGILVTALTEILGYADRLRATELSLGYVLASGCLVWILLSTRHSPRNGRTESSPTETLEWTVADRVLFAYLALVAIVTGVIAIVVPPNMYDLLTYHMTRVLHWIQNGNVSSFPTYNMRQIYVAPWANYAELQFQLLVGGDRLASVTSWLAMIGMIVAASSIAGEMGAGPRVQLWTAVISASIPSGILQGESGQADAIAGFWLCCFVWGILRARRTTSEQGVGEAIFVIGGSLGLAMLSKVTAYFIAFPFLVWLCVDTLRRRRSHGVLLLGPIALLALSLNAPFYARNVRVFGDPLRATGTTPDVQAINADLGPRLLILGPLRAAAQHWETPGRLGLKPLLDRAVFKLHRVLGVDPEDPGLAFQNGPSFEVPVPTLGDGTGNPVHFVLALVALLALISRRRRERYGPVVPYAACTLLGFVLLSYLVRWHAANTRYHLPTFVLASPLIAIALAGIRRQRLAVLVPLGAALASLPWLLAAQSRPLVQLGAKAPGQQSVLSGRRDDMYFNGSIEAEREMDFAAAAVREARCTNVGLIERWNDLEYPLWVRIGAPGKARVHHVLVDNATRTVVEDPARAARPCIVLVHADSAKAELMLDGVEYTNRGSRGSMTIFTPSATTKG
jgi:hypothetical protein